MNTPVYFPGLHGLRFIAALTVVIWHIEQIKQLLKIGQPFPLAQAMKLGNDAVTFFFVLSGFLITYLMLVEMQRTGSLQVRKFYARRILRIWPLYYLTVLLGFFIMPPLLKALDYSYTISDFAARLVVYGLFLSNLLLRQALLPTLSHLWTIAIEEQFYLLWPPLLKIGKKHLLLLLVSIIALKTTVSAYAVHTAVQPGYPLWLRDALSIGSNFRIESMAIGALGAYLVAEQRQRVLGILFHPLVEKAALLLMVLHVAFWHGDESPFTTTAFSILYIGFILNVACNPSSTMKLESPMWVWLGNRSYSLYMLHLMVIYPVLLLARHLPLWEQNPLLANGLLFTGIILTNLGVADACYRWFEQPFLRLKSRFEVVETGSSLCKTSP